MLRILYDDFDQKVKNIHDEMDLHHSYKKKRVTHYIILCWSACAIFKMVEKVAVGNGRKYILIIV